ncbi:MAG: PadR family transcriptional regulator [Acidimicrobiia bacterium]|nr:PadR family transcriptional regulator [Acidimicrobiia bacterium]NNF09455.1 PadR family transcriptional regulator [Acidimicrobiia bacterium]NNL71677.1 PadR family transcriptional regulator [Acidimicrobiia bacterium]
MSTQRRLTTTSYALLSQLSLRPWSTYELAGQSARYFRYVWPRAESAIYREVKQLAKAGLVDGRKEYVGRRARTVYSISKAGLAELREWLDTPPSPFAMEFEGMLRLFVAPVAEAGQVEAALKQVRADNQEMLTFAGEVKQEYLDGRGALQDQVYVRALAIDFFANLLNTVDDWAARALDEIARWDSHSVEERNERAMSILAQVPVDTPAQPTTETPVVPDSQRRSARYPRG